MTAPQTAGVDRTIPSDGMTVDTPAGPVDLVAVERIRSGDAARLTRADTLYLNAQLARTAYDYELADQVARGLGITRDGVLRRIDRTRAAAGLAQPRTA